MIQQPCKRSLCNPFYDRMTKIFSIRSSHQRCSIIKGVLRNFARFTGKHLCQDLFFDKVSGLWPATLLKRRLWHRCFPVNFTKFLRTPFLQNTYGRLLLLSLTFYLNLLTQVKFEIQLILKKLHLTAYKICCKGLLLTCRIMRRFSWNDISKYGTTN